MITRLLHALLWLASALAVACFVLFGLRGIDAPLPFDATEAMLLELATRLERHTPLYLPPAVADSPALLPGFPLMASVVVDVLGPQLLWLRMLSLCAILALAVLAMAVVHEETDHRLLAVAAGSMVLAGYGVLAANPAAARPEPLMLLLAMGGALSLRALPGAAGGLVASLMLAAASFTHAQALWLAGGVLIYLTREDRGRLLPYVLGLGIFLGGGYVLLSRTLGPWFNYYAWDLPLAALRFDGEGLLGLLADRLLGTLGVLSVMTVLAFALPTRPWRGTGGLWSCIGLAGVAAGLLATQSAAPEPQGLVTCVTALAMVGAISMHRVVQHLSTWPDSTRTAGEGTVLVALALQFVALFAGVPPTLFMLRM